MAINTTFLMDFILQILGLNFHQNGSPAEQINNVPQDMKLNIRNRGRCYSPGWLAAPLSTLMFP
jgi:hypothetical protein